MLAGIARVRECGSKWCSATSGLRIKVQDWGVGFNPAAIEEDHFGLEGIRERARLLGGATVIESSPEQGTSITVELPFGAEGRLTDVASVGQTFLSAGRKAPCLADRNVCPTGFWATEDAG